MNSSTLMYGHQVGEKVWVLNPDNFNPQPKKKGPYFVVVDHDNNYYTFHNPKGNLKRFHPRYAFKEKRC